LVLTCNTPSPAWRWVTREYHIKRGKLIWLNYWELLTRSITPAERRNYGRRKT